MLEAKKGFRRLKAYKQLPKLRDAFVVNLRTAKSLGLLARPMRS